ncbi:MAG: ATP-binding protein [Phycisphaerales bacterium]
MNLIGNAIKLVAGVLVRASMDTSYAILQVSVNDTGIGIGPEQIRRLFGAVRPGRRLDDPKVRGTGLGLQISRRSRVDDGRGHQVESTPGRGARSR